ncbi:MAG: NADPH-dependent glutamate synthase [Chloroflexota bacterium]|nr:MAG: NADPH-dependent glutamate synthase [Chloroflexota bacterium]
MAKLNPNRMEMPQQDPSVRRRNFDEVALGYDAGMAMQEANRCLQCKNKPCMTGCPVSVRIPEFILALRESNLPAAAEILKSKNNLPAICGRVCPQENQCEKVCLVGKKGAPVAIGRLERFVADWQLFQSAESEKIELPAPTNKRVAVIGAGPAGLTAAADLARQGHRVTIFEALHLPGGVLRYGIPRFRLPDDVVRKEIDYVQRLGVEFVMDMVVGKTVTVDELFADGYQAVFLGTGAGLPTFQNIPGENLNGVASANEILSRVNLMKAYQFPEASDTPVLTGRRVAVIGAGNVAMDSVRTSIRLGAEEAYIVYRRSEQEIPARHEEMEHAKEEGVIFKLLTAPTRILGDERGWVKAMECQQMELGEPDASGRRRPVPIPGSEFTMDVDLVIVAIGTSPNPLVPRTTQGLEIGGHGTIKAEQETGATTRKGVWAGGDAVTGAATVIEAMGAGKRAAAAIDAYVRELD